MSREQFEHYASRGFKRIPVSLELPSDLDTPLSVFLKLAGSARTCLLESVYGGDRWGRYSIIGLPASERIQARGHTLRVIDADDTVKELGVSDPLGWLHEYLSRRAAPQVKGLPRFCGGLVGYFGYETIRYIERRLEGIGGRSLDVPDLELLVCNEVAIFDNLRGSLRLVVHANPDASPRAYDEAHERLDELAKQLATKPLPSSSRSRTVAVGDEAEFESSLTRGEYEDAVRSIQRYIVDGEAMQVVISRCLSTSFKASPLDLYRVLRRLNPSPYMYFLNFGALNVVGSSPEVLVRLEGDTVTVRPIAGTRPRGGDETEDQVLERELLADPKELAEHLMLIDLGRNDVGRVAEVGSVAVTERMIIERYSHVMHIVSNVSGKLRAGLGPIDVLRAAFPAGTLTGAPKIRAMEIIDELEPTHRHLYGGAVGYLSWSRNMDLAIAIRSAMLHDGMLYSQVGAGIVADSKPTAEWEETVHKSRALCHAVALVRAGAVS